MSKSAVAYALATIVVPALTAATLATPQPSGEQIAGIFSLKIGQQHVLPVAGQAGPLLLLTESQGTNRSTGPTRYMEGAQVISRELADLTQGNGAHQGYITEILGADTTVSRYQGKVVTILGADQKPQTSFEGTWSKVSGTGKYQGVSGAGRYKGRMTSQTEYTVEYTGEIVTPRTASR